MTPDEISKSLQVYEDAFIKVSFEEDTPDPSPDMGTVDPMYKSWGEQSSDKYVDVPSFGAKTLRELFPKHTVIPFAYVNVLGFPGTIIQPVSPPDLVTDNFFVPIATRMGKSTGVIISQVRFGSFHVAWDKYDFLLYVISYPAGFGERTQQYLLHDGPEEPGRGLLLAAGVWGNELHEEVYVFNQGWWQKNHTLWVEIQKANWNDIILKDEFKKKLKKDVYGFFDSEGLYKSLAIPWKRGLIMYGPPGNGKTISMKAIMKDCDARGYTPLYVKSFQSWMGEEASMAAVFDKARQMAPCLLILEDLDSLINDQNRSFFLNELDGFEGNDGLLVMASTNHFDRLDPGLSGRPSRFDRKYSFDDPDLAERALYAKYWQGKLSTNEDIDFPDSLVEEVAKRTAKFSFAYLKEAFVSTLVLLADTEGEKSDFATLLWGQIKSLRDQLEKDPGHVQNNNSLRGLWPTPPRVQLPQRHERNARPGLFGPPSRPPSSAVYGEGSRSSFAGRATPPWRTAPVHSTPTAGMPGEFLDPMTNGLGRDMENMALAAAAAGRSFIA